jgi:hypothetical protein
MYEKTTVGTLKFPGRKTAYPDMNIIAKLATKA